MAGRVMQEADRLGVTLRYGGDWDMDETVVSDQTFQDLVHFEIYEKGLSNDIIRTDACYDG